MSVKVCEPIICTETFDMRSQLIVQSLQRDYRDPSFEAGGRELSAGQKSALSIPMTKSTA